MGVKQKAIGCFAYDKTVTLVPGVFQALKYKRVVILESNAKREWSEIVVGHFGKLAGRFTYVYSEVILCGL